MQHMGTQTISCVRTFSNNHPPEDLLRNTAVLLDKLLDSSEDLLGQWTSRDLVEVICEAAEQTRYQMYIDPL